MYEQAEEEIHGRMSFIGFMGYPDILPGAKVTGVFRYLLPTTEETKSYGKNCRGKLINGAPC